MRKKGYELVKPVLEAFRGLPRRLEELFGKSEQLHRSYGYAPRSLDPLSNGNVSPVDHFLRMCDQYEAAAPGAGKMLGSLISMELRHRYEDAAPTRDEFELVAKLHKEASEAIQALMKQRELMSRHELAAGVEELRELRDATDAAIGALVAEQRLRQVPEGEVVN